MNFESCQIFKQMQYYFQQKPSGFVGVYQKIALFSKRCSLVRKSYEKDVRICECW